LLGRQRVWVQDAPHQTTFGRTYSNCATCK